MAVKLQDDRDSQGNHGTRRPLRTIQTVFGVPLSPAPLRAVSVNAAKALMDIFPIRHKEENRLRIEGSDGNVIFNVIVPQNPVKDGEAET